MSEIIETDSYDSSSDNDSSDDEHMCKISIVELAPTEEDISLDASKEYIFEVINDFLHIKDLLIAFSTQRNHNVDTELRELRNRSTNVIGWSTPNLNALNEISKFMQLSKVLEVGAGLGIWSQSNLDAV